MNKNKINLKDDNNRRDRDNKPDKKEIQEFTVQHQKRGDLKVTGKTQGARTKEDAGK